MMFYYSYLFFLFISSIKSCPLKTVDSRSGCYCGIEIDGTNYIQCQPYSIKKIPEFTRSYIHDKLNLSFNFIHHITNQSFHQLKVRKIYLQDNFIEFIDKQSFDNNILNYLEELHLDMLNNGSLEFLCYGTWNKLRVLELSGFHFNHYEHCLEKFHRLEKLIIKNSQIDFLSSHLYKLPYLQELALINNQMEYLKFNKDDTSRSSVIKILNLTSNQFRTIPNDLFHHMPLLHTLDLSHNLIENLPVLNEYHFLNINLSYNLINYIQLNDHQHHYDLSLNPICTLEKNQVNGNFLFKEITQLHCDCRLAFFLVENFVNKSKIIGINQPFGNQTKCSTPLLVHELFLKDLTYEQLLSTCSDDLPINCREVNHFKRIQKFAKDMMGTTTRTTTRNATQINEVSRKLNNPPDMSSFRLTSFSTTYENNDLIISWDFDPTFSSHHLSLIQFQIILEQESSSNTQIIRRSGFISPHLKQYIIHHIPSNKNYYVCLLLTRSSYGTDKYCRETRTIISTTTTVSNLILSKQAFLHMLFTNRSIVFGFLFGTILTTGLLLTLAFICHLRSKRQRCRREGSSSLFHHPHQPQQHYLYVDRNDDDGTYSNSIFSSSSSTKYNHFKKSRRRTCFPSIPSDQSWYRRGLTQFPTAPPPPPCCFHHHRHPQQHTPDTTMSSSTTARRIATLSSQYSNGMEKEPTTSTSIMSTASSDEQTNNSPAKHVYEELTDETTMLRRNNTTGILL